MAQIDDFFMYENRMEGITDADYQWATAARLTAAQTVLTAVQALAVLTTVPAHRPAARPTLVLAAATSKTAVPTVATPRLLRPAPAAAATSRTASKLTGKSTSKSASNRLKI